MMAKAQVGVPFVCQTNKPSPATYLAAMGLPTGFHLNRFEGKMSGTSRC